MSCYDSFLIGLLFLLATIKDRREGQVERQHASNGTLGAARNTTNAMQVELIELKFRPIRNDTNMKIDRMLSDLEMYDKLNLNTFFIGLLCWQRYKSIKDMRLCLLFGSIDHWSWTPSGRRARLVAHVIWKVPTLPENRDL